MADVDNTLEGKSLREIAENDDLIQKFLNIHRFYLSPRIYQLGMFYTYMISKRVFRQEDQDDVESQPLRLNKIGRFLDIVATKGPEGFRAFLDVLEYEHPHLFLHVTNEKPRDPPHDWRPPMPISAGSMRIKKSMADVISMLTQDAEEKNKMNETLQKCIMDAEGDHRTEREKLKKDLEEITGQKADLQEAIRKYKTDLDELRKTSCNDRDTIERMRQEISVLTAKRRQDMGDCSWIFTNATTCMNCVTQDNFGYLLFDM
ncbi:hypothetical protein NP493_489g03077 [Ridgeia piscesae]|uniref:CARD domain-containing protein n=1 Tax=Ridgeia piscesae TaxID=27915 RepID=A0AAD9KXY0_RIDPI|nr:hypothetical protein NP493_489g03077 [Ridgeia piscesae]